MVYHEIVTTYVEREALRAKLRLWGQRHARDAAERDPLVIAAWKAGITKAEIQRLTGLGGMTINRITAPKRPPA